jgi:hypothetical protein
MRPLLNRRILEDPYGDFDNDDFVEMTVSDFTGIEAWNLKTDEIVFLNNINAKAIYQHWGYRTAAGRHENFELQTNEDSDLRHVQTYTDPLMRSLQQYYDMGYSKFFTNEVIGLFGIQQNYKEYNKVMRRQITDILNKFLEDQKARQAVIQLSRYRLVDSVSLAFLTLVVSARQLVLLAERYYEQAYETGQAFLRFEDQFNEKWVQPSESEDTS